MKTYGVGGIAPRVLTSALDGGEWSSWRPGRFNPCERAPQYPLNRRMGESQSRSYIKFALSCEIIPCLFLVIWYFTLISFHICTCEAPAVGQLGLPSRSNSASFCNRRRRQPLSQSFTADKRMPQVFEMNRRPLCVFCLLAWEDATATLFVLCIAA
jgi:hypothetical protein